MRTLKVKHVKNVLSPLCTDLVIVSPNITLFPVWEDEFSQVRLICILSNFFPKKMSVTWYQNQKPVTDIQPTERTLQSDGRPTSFTAITELEPNMEEWRKGSSFACKAVHNSTEFQKTTSICKCTYSIHYSESHTISYCRLMRVFCSSCSLWKQCSFHSCGDPHL